MTPIQAASGRGNVTAQAEKAELAASPRLCRICRSDEPHHVHNGEDRIEDYFTVGRGQQPMGAALDWHHRYGRLRDAATAYLSALDGTRSTNDPDEQASWGVGAEQNERVLRHLLEPTP